MASLCLRDSSNLSISAMASAISSSSLLDSLKIKIQSNYLYVKKLCGRNVTCTTHYYIHQIISESIYTISAYQIKEQGRLQLF